MTLTAAAVLAESALRRPDHPALVFGSRRITYRELWDATRRYAAVLRDQGIGPGDRVALLLPNTPHFPMVYYGVLALGAVAVPVHGLLRADEIVHVLRDSESKVLVCGAPMLTEGAKGAEVAGVPVVTVLAEHDGGRPRLDALAEGAEPIERCVPREPGDLAVVLYTSGTTGHPKGAMITQFNLVMNVSTTMRSPFDLGPDDVLLGCLPLFHTFGQTCGMSTTFLAGGTMVLMSRFDGPRALDLMVTEGCTVFMGVPTMYLALLDAAAEDPRRPALDRAFSGGSALPVKVLEDFQEVFGCPIYEGYGLTEASPVVAYNQKAWPCKPGTVGRPIWGVEAEIAAADVEDRVELLPTGAVGEIVIRGHNVMAGYLNRPEATAEVLVDGWFRSGDLGTKDAEGYLTLVDRKKDLVVRGGYNVYPREVEDVLMRHPAIAQVAVIGLPDEVYGEEVCAVVRPRTGTVPDAALGSGIVAWARERLAGHKYPRRVEFIDAFPLGPSGKVLKRELAGRFTTGR
ncbi:long-chain-fatty-acid--CoA ligase [Streptomyces rapamycinicus]|uniref:Long-chain-fatty-acid--CoA ligase n=2 Tax=Streptomyces rapamycinicus TaxID=1226757 RepID=A0A0A0NT12_STRRN|nr:long-chain fatty acid--CoA ligase [Streptomyces rapamycinicus]AGP60631.1 AMP-dependent synthetase [Streptomyces rapamycinicus NRRL 5491]MBB4788201.1 long-chain acyl-CoA synthetase [Streptomyces rapamycinicus]RLV72536.1 long-chain-fatty-acid--CoA ligase [Streptomyces rapamycinicus NRRL 5491]UTP36184.1 long-chain fatty acid--CoA ligase [Streptomyces rapamycinicus NRRL 5491]